MKRLFITALLAAATVGLVDAPRPALAQMANALGKPLPSGDLDAGSVVIRVIAGNPSKPVIGRDVTLLVNGQPRVARTDDGGRATFKQLPAGASVQAKVAGDDGKEAASDTFPVPAQGGVRVMLSTLPWNPGASAGAPPMAGGGPGMPSPRAMSGEPRPEPNDVPGTYTARVAYDDFKDVPAPGQQVTLVGYHANDLIDLQVAATDAEGRATFKNLDRTGAVSYFAMALVPRNDKLDRLTSTPVVMDPRAGVRVILSSDKRASTAPPIDDLTRFEKQDSAPPPGKVRITLEGGVEPGATVSLMEIAAREGSTPGAVANERRTYASGKPMAGPPDPQDIRASAQFETTQGAPANSLEVRVHGGVNRTDGPLEGITVLVAPASEIAQRQGQVDARTGADGVAKVTVPPDRKGPFVAIVTINGKALSTKEFDLQPQGGSIDVEAHWDSEGKAQVEFDLIPRPGQVFYAETMMHGQLYRSLPFQPVPDRGTRVSIFVYPRVLFTFSLTSRVDDKYLAVNGRFEISNNSWAPYTGGPDGVMIPLPAKFTGGLVADKDQNEVALVPGEGFRIIRPLAPGQKQFHGAFSLPVDDGNVSWRWDLPYGSFNSGMEILQAPGMTVQTPPGVKGETMTVPQGTFFVLPQVSIMPKQSMVMTIMGLPQPPSWKLWLPRIFGVLVVVMMLGGLAAALLRKRDVTSEREARRQKLLDELVTLEQAGKTKQNAKRREQIMSELESLWGDDGEGSTRPAA